MWNELWQEHRGSLIGLAIGLLLGFIYLFAGFWNMFVFSLIVFIAFVVGKHYAFVDAYLQDITRRLLDRFRS